MVVNEVRNFACHLYWMIRTCIDHRQSGSSRWEVLKCWACWLIASRVARARGFISLATSCYSLKSRQNSYRFSRATPRVTVTPCPRVIAPCTRSSHADSRERQAFCRQPETITSATFKTTLTSWKYSVTHGCYAAWHSGDWKRQSGVL